MIAACEFEQEDMASCKGHLDQCIQDDADTVVAQVLLLLLLLLLLLRWWWRWW